MNSSFPSRPFIIDVLPQRRHHAPVRRRKRHMFDPQTLKLRIATMLKTSCPGYDVSVRIERNPYGFWVWDEEAQVHQHVTPGFLMWALGERQPLPEFALRWQDVKSG